MQTQSKDEPMKSQRNDAARPSPDLCGVNGWLKFFVVIKIYVAPALFVVTTIIQWSVIVRLGLSQPVSILIGLLYTGVGGFLTYRWIEIGLLLRDIAPGAVGETRRWLTVTVLAQIGLSIVATTSEALIARNFDGEMFLWRIAAFVASYLIWYGYFRRSRRVRATYPDWDARIDYGDAAGKQHEAQYSDRSCPSCGQRLRVVQAVSMVGHPGYNAWCREGFCSLKCFEKQRADAMAGHAAPGKAVPPASPNGCMDPEEGRS